MPLAALLGVLAEPAVHLFLGPKAAPAVAYVQVFVLYGAVRSCGIGITPLFMVLNRPALATQVTFASTAVRLIVLLTGFSMFGLMAVPWSLVASGGVMVVLLWWWSVRLGVLRAIDVPTAVWRPLAATALMVLMMDFMLDAMRSELNSLALLLLIGGLGVALYLLSVLTLWRLAGRPNGPERSAIDLLRARLGRSASGLG
jgi:O-antigen/teichoic acid export membrane protein